MARAVGRSAKSKTSAVKPKARARRAAAKAAPARRRVDPAPIPTKRRARSTKPAPTAPAPAVRPASRKAVPAAAPARRRGQEPLPPETAVAAGLTDEEQIESAKYLPRRVPPRVFEEERFLFPQTYGVNRLRLLVKDPEWLFAHWDVDPRSLESVRAELGERASALSRLTLRIFEDKRGGSSMFLFPQDVRTWYVPAGAPGRAYRAEVGVMLPSGEFRPLARSNSVVTPRTGKSAQKARRRVRYDRARPLVPGAAGLPHGEDLAADEQPWDTPLDAWARPEEERPAAPLSSRGGKSVTVERGGSSDLHRR